MSKVEVNSNLQTIKHYQTFFDEIIKVWGVFVECFGGNIMYKIDIFIDNATENSGYTPTIIPAFGKCLIIKLGIHDFSNREQITFQLAHEFGHYVFYALLGLDKSLAGIKEENLCTALSLGVIARLYPEKTAFWADYVNGLKEEKYNLGDMIAKSCNYSIYKIKNLILEECRRLYDGGL